jgi:hypothetical protein
LFYFGRFNSLSLVVDTFRSILLFNASRRVLLRYVDCLWRQKLT